MRQWAGMVCALAALVGLLGLGNPATAQEATPRAGELTLHGTITATGRYIFNWLDDDLCTLSFWDYDFTPELVVSDEDGAPLATLSLAELPGSVTMAGTGDQRHAEECAVPFELALPTSEAYVVTLDPYFTSEALPAAELVATDGLIDIAFERQASDAGPDFRDRPAGKLPGTDLYRIAGTVELLADSGDISFFALPIGGCMGMGGYEDLQAGKQITVRDETGTMIGVGGLEPIYLPSEGIDNQRCVFTFTIDVPEARFYTLEMERRGVLTYSKAELDTAEWHIDLSLGR